ncbi:MAG: hypothetical protein HOB40_05790 [Candidatus Marinimicrobia bacterium]|jgi:hypothetical protein|nr:hypothetical protein [Candidatus Neomarinimicrobiota bacterium]MBT3840315.1 hypothetical protein [Candidatus Neomarinimicrobiota bacterium]MBT4000313.1 hypothetical protein [Candidatus Neomarinimicrobiota bacterium]MBT4382597.1 hypothetical protein [Candidatus Neomarinimicrobiota bacterium]MBT4578520.1 hypothetical protein [Candidatus Neomarinimicrobiota bacterium]
MSKDKMKVGEISKPRFEFRSFGQDFIDQAERMARLSVPIPEKLWVRHSPEIYIMSRTNDENNTKIRDGKMDIKTYVKTIDGLEQWNPLTKTEFPVSVDFLKSDIFPAFQVEMPNFEKDKYSRDEFLNMVKAHPDLQAVTVVKERYGYMVNDTICEVGYVLVNGATIMSINSESTELGDIKKTMTDVGLNDVENINYLQAIKRVIGWIDKPLAN